MRDSGKYHLRPQNVLPPGSGPGCPDLCPKNGVTLSARPESFPWKVSVIIISRFLYEIVFKQGKNLLRNRPFINMLSEETLEAEYFVTLINPFSGFRVLQVEPDSIDPRRDFGHECADPVCQFQSIVSHSIRPEPGRDRPRQGKRFSGSCSLNPANVRQGHLIRVREPQKSEMVWLLQMIIQII